VFLIYDLILNDHKIFENEGDVSFVRRNLVDNKQYLEALIHFISDTVYDNH
jgi:hypothetical protein